LKRYEGLFLFDNTNIHQWADMEAEVRRLCERIGADLLICLKFDERKLAYEIRGRKRGTYVLTYFDAEPGRIGDLERDARLSELLLRSLILRADGANEEKLTKLKELPPDQPLQPLSGEGRRGDFPRSRDRHESAGDRRRDVERGGGERREGGAEFAESRPEGVFTAEPASGRERSAAGRAAADDE